MADYPEDLDYSFSRGDLSLLGISWREISGPLWRSPFRGIHVWAGTDPTDPRQRALDAARLVPDGGAIGGWAAARIGGIKEFDGAGYGGGMPVPLCLPPHRRRRRGPAVCEWRSELAPEDIHLVDGVPVTSPVRTGFDIARKASLLGGLTAVDLLARGRPEFLDDLRAYTEKHPGLGGVGKVRTLLDLASPLTRSPRETAFRLFWVRECGLPPPQVNACVYDLDGRFLGMTDLLDPAAGFAGEYDGAVHRELIRHALDNAREEDLERAGLTVARVTDPDLGQFRERTRARLVDGHRMAARRRDTAAVRWLWRPGPLPDPLPHW